MKMEKQLPKRKNIRWQDYDYNLEGSYFITVCTYNRKSTLAQVVGAIHESPETKLSEYGKILDKYVNSIPKHLSVTVDRYVIMPNHIHLLLIVNDDMRAIRESPLRSSRSVISKAVGYIKMNTSKEINARYGKQNLWQRGFYDHVIRNQEDYEKHIDYICNNPICWEFDKLYSEE